MSSIYLSPVKDVLSKIHQGDMVILVDDDASSSSAGVVMVSAEYVDASHVNFMARQARGLVCLALTQARCDQLGLVNMVPGGSDSKPNFTISIEAAKGIDTGISAADRALTIRTAVDPSASPEDIVQPGHVFPLMVAPGGVLIRAGLTEAASDYSGLSGLSSAAVIADVLTADGELADIASLAEFASRHDLLIGSVADLIDYRLTNEQTVSKIRGGSISTASGRFNLEVYKDSVIGGIHMALWKGDLSREQDTLVRVHVGSIMRDLVDCELVSESSWSFARSIEYISKASSGVLVLLDDAETEQQLLANIDLSLGIEQTRQITYTDSSKTVGLGAQILRDLGVGKIRLMGTPIRYNALSGFGLEVVEFVSPNVNKD